MDSLELLNVLDVIKNEEIYTKRLNELKKVQEKLDQSKHIVATSELAERKLALAEEKDAKAKELIQKLEEDLRRVHQEVQKEYEERLAKVAQREKAILTYQSDAKESLVQAHHQREKNEIERATLSEWDRVLNKQKADFQEMEAKLTSKFIRIQQIIEE